MTVTLTPDTEAYVNAQLAEGIFESPAEVLEALIKLKPPVVCRDHSGNLLTRDELESELLKAVRGPHEPWRGREEVEEIMARVAEHPKPGRE